MGWLNKFKSWLGKDPEETGKLPKVRWLPPGQQPFPMSVLDLSPLTQTLIATTSVEANAEKAVSWQDSCGLSLQGESPEDPVTVPCELRYTTDCELPDGLLFTPTTMDQKWVLALLGDTIVAARSWTGAVEAVAYLRKTSGLIRVDRLAYSRNGAFSMYGNPVDTFDWLLRSHALGQKIPLPVDDEAAELLERVPLTAFSSFGNMVLCAAKEWGPPDPIHGLRVDGELLAAVRIQDIDKIEALASQGLAIDAPTTFQGYSCLQVALIGKSTGVVTKLLSLGANPNHSAERGATPLGVAIVHGCDTELLETLRVAGGAIDSVNEDGFDLVHAAAETDRSEVIDWLSDAGKEIENKTNSGLTPLHIACGLGHAKAASALLRLGANIEVTSSRGTPLEVAQAEGKVNCVQLLQDWVKPE